MTIIYSDSQFNLNRLSDYIRSRIRLNPVNNLSDAVDRKFGKIPLTLPKRIFKLKYNTIRPLCQILPHFPKQELSPDPTCQI